MIPRSLFATSDNYYYVNLCSVSHSQVIQPHQINSIVGNVNHPGVGTPNKKLGQVQTPPVVSAAGLRWQLEFSHDCQYLRPDSKNFVGNKKGLTI